MERLHDLKLSWAFWNEVMSGEKCFELRENDRGFQKGDQVLFREVDKKGTLTGRTSGNFEITYVLHGWGMKENYVAFGIKKSISDV